MNNPSDKTDFYAGKPLGRKARRFWAYFLKLVEQYPDGGPICLTVDQESVPNVALVYLTPTHIPFDETLPGGITYAPGLMPDALGRYVPLGKGYRAPINFVDGYSANLPRNYPYNLCPGAQR